MWLQFLCIIVIASGAIAEDELLDSLYGVEGKNKMSICVGSPSGRWRSCDGALFNREWIITRAHCLRTSPKDLMYTVRLSAGDSCDDIAAGYSLHTSRDVRAILMHPWFDLALVIVHRPYNDLDRLPNATDVNMNLKMHGVRRWMQHRFNIYALTRNTHYHLQLVARDMKAYNYPFLIFFTTILTPSLLLMLVFIYITFYTGTPVEVPYQKLQYSKKITHI